MRSQRGQVHNIRILKTGIYLISWSSFIILLFIADISCNHFGMIVDGKYSNVLFISDMHLPYGHVDTFPFLKAIKEVLKPELVICLGDELDYHSISFHKPNPDLLSPGDELRLAIQQIQPFYELFPEMLLVDSNHGSLVYRKVKDAGLPMHVIKPYQDVLGSPKGWTWHEDLLLTTKENKKIYVCHGRGANTLKESQSEGMSFISGHWHSTFGINYWANREFLHFSMSCGCLADQKSMAFEYSKNFSKKFIVGTGVLMNGQPRLLPMVLNENGRWIRKLV